MNYCVEVFMQNDPQITAELKNKTPAKHRDIFRDTLIAKKVWRRRGSNPRPTGWEKNSSTHLCGRKIKNLKLFHISHVGLCRILCPAGYSGRFTKDIRFRFGPEL